MIAREMTKKHEEFLRGTVSALLKTIGETTIKGEITLILWGLHARAGGDEPSKEEEDIPAHFERIKKDKGLSDKEAMRQVARERGIARRDVYRELLKPGR